MSQKPILSTGMGGPKVRVVKPQGDLNPDINVTPLIDVVLVLLIIFMVITPLLNADIFVQLPETTEAEAADDVPKEQLLVSALADGRVALNGHAKTMEELGVELQKRLTKRKAKERIVFFVADDQADYSLLVTAMDTARHAGARTLGLATDVPPNPGQQTPSQELQK